MSAARGLADVALPDLVVLRRAVEERRLPCPLTRAGLLSVGLAHVAERANVLAGLGREAVLAACAVAVAEREQRPVPRLELVWTGPEAAVSAARDTAVVVRRLFEDARQAVLVGGFRFDHGAELLRPLHVAMADRDVDVTIFLDVEADARDDAGVDALADAAVERFFARNWPFGRPFPEVFYDPRGAQPGARASLHAKCVVVDERWSLVTSANFTDRGQTRNIEAGVLIDDPGFAARLARQWRGLIEAGLVRRHVE